MCCFISVLLFFGPRLALLVYWLLPAGQYRMQVAFNSLLWPLLGLIFLPWTALAYVLLFPMYGLDWVILGIALLADLSAYSGGARHRRRLPGYRGL
jgi:hypothetical protein